MTRDVGHEYHDLLNVDSHTKFELQLRELIFDKEKRESFYRNLLNYNADVSKDSFRDYFEYYSSERKTNMQDLTPESIAGMLSELIDNDELDKGIIYDPAAGTGSLIINKWNQILRKTNPLAYLPHEHFHIAEEKSDNAIIYLIHNLALRGMNAVVIYGDTLERSAKQVFLIQNPRDDHLIFSDINVFPHTDVVADYFNIDLWSEEEITYSESDIENVSWRFWSNKHNELISDLLSMIEF